MDILHFLQFYLFAESKLWTTFTKYLKSLHHKLQSKNPIITTDESNETTFAPL